MFAPRRTIPHPQRNFPHARPPAICGIGVVGIARFGAALADAEAVARRRKRFALMFCLPVAGWFICASAVFARDADERSQSSVATTGETETAASQPPRWVRTERRVDKLPRTTAKRLLGTNGMATSLEALQSILEPGHQVVFVQHGKSRLATAVERSWLSIRQEVLVAEVSPDRIVLVRTRLFRRQEIVLTPDWIDRIDIVDSTRNGVLLGTGIGGVLGIAEILQTRREARSRDDCNLCPLGYMFGALLPIIGGGLGGRIDAAINSPIYERPSQRSRVILGPLLGRERVGVLAEVRF